MTEHLLSDEKITILHEHMHKRETKTVITGETIAQMQDRLEQQDDAIKRLTRDVEWLLREVSYLKHCRKGGE